MFALKMPIHAPFWGVFGIKIGENVNFLHFYVQRYTSAVYAVVVCVDLSVCVSHNLVLYYKRA